MSTKKIVYTMPKFSDSEIAMVNELLHCPESFLNEKFTKAARQLLKDRYQREVLPTHSCTAALEMSALLLNIQPGDEVIIPTYTFVSTASAYALFGARPIFVDIDRNTLNIDPALIESAITPKTKAIVIVHYAAVSCDMEKIQAIADKYDLPIVEDAAQCIGASYHQQQLGTIGSLAALSFHHTKNITSGLGGALIINDESLIERAKIIWQKGTNREAFFEGIVDKYTWQDLGSSYMINELGAALLNGQLSRLDDITQKRLAIWNKYHNAFVKLENNGFKRPSVPTGCQHNGHIYYLIAPDEKTASQLRESLATTNIVAPSHYVPLHLSPAGKKFSGNNKSLPVSENIYKRIIRLPIWEGIEVHIDDIVAQVYHATSIDDVPII